MWSDSIFASQDREKLLYLARCCAAAYGATPASLSAITGSPVTQRTDSPLPRSYSWVKEGETLLCVEGSVESANYLPQLNGWIFVQSVPGGVVNSYYHDTSNDIYLSSPAGVGLCFGHSRGGAVAANVSRRMIAAGGSTRTVAFGSPRFASSGSAAMPYWGQSLFLSSPLDMVSEMPYGGFAGVDWRLPPQEASITPYGISLSSNSPSTFSNLAAIAYTVGDTYHAIGAYIAALGSLPSFPPNPMLGARNMYRVTVRGVMHDQSIINEFWYRNTGGADTAENLATNFSSRWASMICPRVSNAYSVLQYDVRKLFGAVATDPVVPAAGSTWRWSEQFIKNGTTADAGLIAAGVAMPSFVAVGFTKTVGPWFNADATNAPGLKLGRGSGRIAGPAEEYTGAAGSNRIIPASLDAWRNALETLRILNVAGTWDMIIATNSYEGAPVTTGDPPVPSYRYAYVTGISVNPYMTSQISRKQRISNLG